MTDNELILKALLSGKARWELLPSGRRGELCFMSICHIANLTTEGLPKLSTNAMQQLRKMMGEEG